MLSTESTSSLIETALGTTSATPANTTWYVSGLGAGSVGAVVFTDVENLVGADDNEDEFIFSATGGLTGSVEGGERGFDTVVLDGGQFESVVYKAFNGNDGTIARDSNVLTYTGFEPLVDKTEGGTRIIETSDQADNIKVSRDGGKIKIESVDSTPTFEHVIFDVDPTALTIRTGAQSILPSGSDTVTIEELTYGGDLTIETGSLNAMEDAKDTIIFAGNLTLEGKKLFATAETITVSSGVTVKTSNTGGAAGDITLNSWKTTVSTNAKLLAEGKDATGAEHGDIRLHGIDDAAIATPILNIDIKDVGVTVESGAQIKGGDVIIVAKADSRSVFTTSEWFKTGDTSKSSIDTTGFGTTALDFGLGLVEGLLGVVSVAKSTATVDIQAGSTIDAKGNFEARATSLVSPTAVPVIPVLAIGIAITDTTVTVAGEVTVGGDATIVANAEHTVNVASDSTTIKGVAPSFVVSVIDSDTKAHVTDDAKLTIGGDLLLKSSTIDRNRTMARSTAGKDGDVAIAVAVSIEQGKTEALLDGGVTAATVDISASMSKEVVPIKQLFVVPSFGNGTAALAGVGSDSLGDLLDDTKAQVIVSAKGGISKAYTWVKEKFTGPASEKQQKDDTVTKNNARSFDAAAAIAVVVDSNLTTARVGDGGVDGDGDNGSLVATGAVNVLASVKSRPDVTAGSMAAVNPEATGNAAAETKFGGSLAVAVGVYTNEAHAIVSDQAFVSSQQTLTVDAEALNEIDPFSLWGVNLITPFLTTADFNSTQGSQDVAVGKVVDVISGHTAGGDTGNWYKFIGDKTETINLGAEDYSNNTRWQDLGNPVKHILLDKWVPTVATYLNDNLGLDANLVDTWSQAVAEGQKTALAGAVTVLDLDQTAEAVIKAGAKINQPEGGGVATTNGNQHVVLDADTTSHLVNFSGNIKLPGLTGTKNSYKPSFSSPGLGSTSAKGGDAVGATVMVFDLDNTTIARIEDGVKLAGDSLQLTADTFVVNAALGASGGESDDFGLNGAFIVSLVDNMTIAHVENGALIAVGSKAVSDDNGKGASILLDAEDKTYVVTVSGGVATSEHIGVGLSAGVNLINRDTQAVIGNLHDKAAADTRASFTSLGDVRLNARNEGFAGTVVVAGAKASQKSDDPTATSGSTGMKKSDGTTTDDPGKWPNNQKSYDSVIAELQAKFGGATPAQEATGAKQSKSGIAISGAAAVTVIDDNARAYIHQAGVLSATGKAVLLAAANDTHVGSLAGGIAFAGDPKSASTDVAIAGAFTGNFVSGTTAASLDDATSITASSLAIEADRSGYIVSLTAGVSGASGRKGIAIGGSIGVTMTDYTTETGLANTTGTISGALTLESTDDTNIILVAGSAGFGGKAGIGAAVAFTEIGNTTRATIDAVTNLKVSGPLSVLATSDSLIVAVTGSAGVGTGANSSFGLAGTVTVNHIANTVEASILNSTFHADSTGDITIKATDGSFIFSFAGAFASGKTAGVGVAAAVNLLDNTVSAHVEGSTLRSTGKFDLEAEQTGTLVSVAVGGAVSEKVAVSGSITVNDIDNTIEAIVDKGSDIKVGGAIDIHAHDTSVSVTVSGAAGFGKTAAVGAAFAGNFVSNTLTANVDDAIVESTGSSASAGASARATLVTVAVGAAGGKTFALGGSVAVNEVSNTIESSITDSNGAGTGKAALLKAKNDIAISAADSTMMVVVAGGLAFSTTAAVGVSASTTQVLNKVHAFVDGAAVNSTTGKVSVTAGFKPPETDADMKAISVGTSGVELPESAGSQIINIAVGVAGSGTFAGGGAFSLNWIRNDVQAYAVNGAKITGAGDITIAAFDDPEIDSFAVGGGIGTGTAGAALGLSYNYIGGDPGNPSRDIPSNPASANVGKAIANVNASTVTSTAGSVSVLAGTTPKIINATIAGAGGGTVGVGGSFSINFIRSIVEASVTGKSSLTANTDINVSASAVPVMISIAGNINVGGTAGIGVASSTNDMQSKITAKIDDSKAKATTGNLTVDATVGRPDSLPAHALVNADKGGVPIDAQIWSVAVAGSGAGNAAVAGSLSLNWIRNDVSATISNITDVDPSADEISAGGKISVTASDDSTINAIAGAISVAISAGSGAGGAAVAYNYLGGDPNNPGTTNNNKVTAAIENVSGQLKAASIDVKAAYTGSVNNITLGAAGAQNFALGGSVSINKIRNTADAHISNSSAISTTSGNIAIEAKDTSTIRALAGGVGVSVAAGGGFAGAFGIGAADNTIANTTKAYIDKSTVTSAAALSLTADSKQKIQTLTIGGAVAGAAGDGLAVSAAGSGSGNTVDNNVLAYITGSGGSHEVKTNNGSITLSAKDESTIQAATGAVAVSVAAGSFGAVGASIGISAAVNDITNNVKAYIDGSKVTATNGDVDIKATEDATIEAFAVGGAVAVAAGGLGAATLAGAGAGTGNTIGNTVQAYVTGSSTVSTVTSGAVKLSATDTSTIIADSGGVAISVAAGGAAGASGAVGASASENKITNTIQAFVGGSSTVTSAGAVEITATSSPTIDAFSLGGAVSVAAGAGGAGAFAGAGSGAGNTISNTVQAYVSGASTKVTSQGGAVKLSATDTSKIHIDSGGVAVAVAGGTGTAAASVGASVAINKITNTVQSYIDAATVTSSNAVELSATSTPTIEAVSVAGAVAVAAGGGAGAGAGSGASSKNTINNTVEAYTKGATVTSQNSGNVSLTSTETGTITAHTFGGSVSVAAGASAGAIAISVSLADNDVFSNVRSYVEDTKLTSAGALDIKASSSETTDSMSIAVSVAVAGAPVGGAFSGGGANSFSRVHNTVEAYAKGASGKTIQAAGLVTISASETSNLSADVGVGSAAVGLAAGSIGVSIASNKADSTINAYVDGGALTSTGSGLSISATANDTISKTLGVATSLAIGFGGSAAGAEATAEVTPAINAYIGSGATVNAAGNVTITAKSIASSNAETYGASGGFVSVGGSHAIAKAGGEVKAHVDGAIASSNNVTVSADATQTAKAAATAVSGGIISGAGADADATVNPTVKAYGAGQITATNAISFAATATPQARADAFGISVGVGSVGVSDATATSALNVDANPGGASTIYNAKSFSVSTAINVPVGSYTARANATGATGGLIGVNATKVRATTSGHAYSTIADGSTLIVSDAVSITAKGDSKDRSEADSFNVGLIAVGGNVSVAKATVDTQAWLGKEVTISNGTDIGGLVDGGRYYVVLDDIRTFVAGAVSTGAETIDLGADHGLKTGDRVVYKAGSTGITGLTSFETYSVELVGATAVRLRSISDDGVVGGVVNLQSAAAGSFQLADARRVRLATTSEKAFKGTPDINLDATTASGAKHQLTPVTGFAASALEFNPATQANSSKETIELPTGHGLLTGAAVTYGRSGGAVLTISATGTDYVHAISESGSGGVIAGAVATANTIVDSKTKAFVADDLDGDLSKTLLRVSKLNINATHTSQYDSELSSIQASLLGYSGGWADNSIKATVEATIGAGADVVTQDLQVTATSKSRKDIVSGPNVKSGSGGVIQGNNAESVSNLENHTAAAIGNNASVRVTGNVLAPGNFLLSAYNDTIGDDEVLLDTGGAFVGSGVKSHINVNVNDATAKIGSDAKIETVGALDMQTRATANFSVHPQAHTYGLAGGAGVDAGVLINNHNDVSIGGKTTVQALGDVNMLAGKERGGARNIFNIRSHGDDLNATAVPISTLKSHVQLNQNNTVTIGNEAVVRTARDANLIGETLSTADIVAFGSGKNWLTAIAGGIDSLLGAGGSAEKKGGTTNHPQTQTVTINGVVEVGILKDQKLTIAKGGGTSETDLAKVTENVGGIKYTTTIESLANNLAAERQRLLTLISEYQGDLESVAAYTAALQQVEQQMFELGLVVETDAYILDKDGNKVLTKVLSVQEGFNVPYITVDPIWAQSGTIRISGGTVVGSGDLKAPGDVNVTIKNDSPAYLRLKGITIPDNEGGTVRWNGDQVTTKTFSGFTGTINAAGDKGSPTITVINTFKEDDPFGGNNVSPWNLFRTPDLEIAGAIDALQAEVFLKSEGSVLARSNILASKLTIEAGGNFVLTATDALFHSGGTPASPEGTGPWSAVQAATELAGKNGGVAVKGSVTGGAGSGFLNNATYVTAVQAALGKAPESNIVAANNVVIVAQSLNVNGILQAGIAEHKATIDTSYAAKITAAETARTQYLNGLVGSASATAAAAGITPDEGFTFFKLTGPQLKVDASGLEYSTSTDPNNNLPVYYNAQANRLEVSPVRVQGGFMSLTGRILNTNPNAQIKVMDGYGQITIKNDLDIPLQINRLDTGAPGKSDQGIEGKLIITDTGAQGLNAQGKLAPLVTEYTRTGSDIQRKQYYFVTPGKTPTLIASGDDPSGSGRQATYTPQSPNYRFYWTTGQDSTKKTYTTYGTSAWLNIDAFAADPDDIVEGPTVEYATPRALAKGNYLALDSSKADYTYEFERILQGTPQTKVEGRWETSTWYGETTYYTKTLEWQGQKDVHTHSIRADRPVSINFIGYDAGAVTVTSKSDVQINGEIQNVKGATSLTTTAGSIIQVNDSVAVGGKSISLSAANSIGAAAVIRTNLDNDAGGSLSAAAANVVRIEEISDDLIVNQVTVNASGDRVELKARSGSILGVSGNLVQGGLVVLDSAGSIGTLGSGGTARTPGAGAMAIRVDTGATSRDTFTAKARGDIYVHEKSGDLRLVSVDTTDQSSGNPLGNVRLVVTGGRLTDANTLEVKDDRTEAVLLGIWDKMNATESTAYISIEATARSTENLRNREYQQYWNYRQSQDNPATMVDESKTYDAKFVVTLSTDERALFEAYYADQGFDAVKIAEAITTLENGRTQEYHDLHKTYGKFGDSFDQDYRYGTSITQLFGAAAVSGKVVTLNGNAFNTGDAVVYHSAGGSISGLVDGKTYYVVADPTNAGKLSLATSREDALKATPVVLDLGAVSGAAHTFSAADLTFGGGAVSDAKDSIELPRHVFATGQAVVFQSNGTGSIAGLTDNETYYVVADGTGKIQLAKTQADATKGAPVVIDLGAVAGNGFSLSEVDVLAQRAAWSTAQLKNSFSISVLGPKDTSGTTATKEAANVIGKDIVLDVTSDVGSIEAIVDITLPLPPAGLSNTQKLALAGAERADVTFYEDLAGTVEITEDLTKTSKTVQLIRIVPKADVDVTVKGALTITSGATVNVGSEESIGIDNVTAADATRIKVQKGLTDAKISSVNVATGDLILEAEELGIGTSTDRLVLDLHAGATLVARAHDDIYLTENAGDMNVIEITSTDGDVYLVSDQSILDADDDDGNLLPFRNILARHVVLEAGKNGSNLLGSIGTDTNYLEIQLQDQQLDLKGNVVVPGGTVTALGDAGVHLREMTGDMLVNSVKANAGDVRLRAAAAILDYKKDPNTDVFGRSITLTADFETIGVTGDDLEIDSSFGGVGSVTTKSGKNVHLVENAGDLRLNTVSVDAGTAFIKAVNGSILNAHADETTPNVLSGNVWLFASQDIGAKALRLTTQSGKLEGQSTSGSTFILNTGALQVGGVTGSESGISSGGEVSLTSKSPITVAKHIDAVDNVLIHATDDGGDGDFVLVKTGYTVTSTAGSITIQAGDEITFEKDVTITAHKNVTVTGADDAGSADDVLVGNDVTVTAATGAIAIQAGDSFTMEKGATLTAAGNVVVTTTDDAANGDFLLVKNGATITSSAGMVALQAGDDLTVEEGAFVDAKTSIILTADYKSADANGATITVDGTLQAPSMQLHGGEQADTIYLSPESLVGDTQIFGHGGDDTITLDHLPSITTTQIVLGKAVRDTVDIDGGEGADSIVINITGKQTDYLVNINDTGTKVDDEDVVTINATADNDLFLLRSNFVAYMNTVDPLEAGKPPSALHSQLERINYNSSVNQLNVNSLGGDDHFYLDDNSAKTTLDGGEGKDFFQVGQLFGSDRKAPNVAVGDEISVLRTTLGFLSRGVSHETTVLGGAHDDTFQVYSNQAELSLQGEGGDDTFIVRSFALADENGNPIIDPALSKIAQSMSKLANAAGGTGADVIQYNVNANLAIDGGDGTDRFILLGSELSDDFVITATHTYGGGHSISYQNVEKVTIDGLQGNDNFFILGTKEGVVTTVAGGHGWDTFHVGGDITRPIVSKAFLDLQAKGMAPAGDHLAAGAIGGPLVIEGGFGPDDFTLRQAVILPTETDELLTQLSNPPDDDESIDTLNIFNDGSVAGDVGTLTADNFHVEGMAAGIGKVASGITYQHVETLEIMLGSGADALTIEATMDELVDGERGPLTIVHGGGGSDTITVNGGGGADSPLVIFGDTEQDGARYAGEPGTLTGQAWSFINAGDDVINASAADGAVAIFGGRGVDTITGSAFGDQLAGGSGDDTINGLAGDDIIYGDSGFNVSVAAVTIPEPNNADSKATRTVYARSLDVVDAPNAAAPAWADSLAAGNDDIFAGDDDDIVIGDLGLVTQTTAENLYNTATVVLVQTKSVESGGDDVIVATPGDDIVFGGSGADDIDAGDGNNVVIGDNGFLELQSPDGVRGVIASSDFAFGGDDTIVTGAGNDVVLGGRGGDVIDAGNGGNAVFGDDGEIIYAADARIVSMTSTSTTFGGGGDQIASGTGDDIVLGGRLDDTINAGSGNNVVFGDSGRILADASSTSEQWAGHRLPAGLFESIEHGDGGNDNITAAGGNDMVLGGNADDTIDAGHGDNLVFGDDGEIVYETDGDLDHVVSTSTTAHGGVDDITTGDGQDIVLGGRAGDEINAGDGNNVVFGDSGRLQAGPESSAERWASHRLEAGTFESIEHGDGGADDITTGIGSDIVVGGNAGDVINAGDGHNLVFGDEGEIVYETDGDLDRVNSTSTTLYGGADDITTGAGQDVIIGGRFGDTIVAGAGDDTVIGDQATIEYTDGIALTITASETSDGGDDTIHAGGDDDVVIGGTGADAIDGGAGRDLVFGDSANLDRSSTLGNFRNPRFRELTGTQIYSTVSETAGSLLIDTNTYFADSRGPAEWADYQVTLLHHETVVASNLYGDDYIAGGADDDMIFGQLGNDVVQGDGSIDVASTGGVRVGASRDAAGLLVLSPSFEAAGDGHDYIEGGGGTDVLFGNNGQDDIIGGSSSLFSRITPDQRPDAADIIFGGAGTDAGRNDAGDTSAQGHANDADTIVGDNGNIYRIVASAGADGASTFRTFNYDNYSASMRIVPRGVTLIDYTPGGPSYVGEPGPMVVGDIGGADEIHGEAGDDTIYGGALSDVIFGDAQDDDLIGGYGHDWISGGTGDDGILGDDGRIFTSRNGTAEPLNGVATAVNQATLVGNGPGTINATVNVTGTLQKNVDLTPFNLDPDHASPSMLYDATFADDMIFGGLGRDFIHAGAGDDAVSGAEALTEAYLVSGSSIVRSDFNRPFNPGDALNYNETTTLMAQYDPANPMRRIVLNADGTLSTNNTGAEFFLNFNKNEGSPVNGSGVFSDGDDIIFGDQGNDWLVGGTGRDHIFAGWGDDLINGDDDHTTNGGLNNQPDAQLSYGDIALGGAGRDVLIANTTADVLVDFGGEFDTFMVPFAKYGPPTVNRIYNPALENFLLSLSAADGADQTRVTPGATGSASGSIDRHGEPFGELGLVTQQDGAAHEQHGGPRDPQSGNEGGTSADSETTAGTSVKNGSAGTTSTATTSTGTTSLTSSTTPTTSTSSAPLTTATTPTTSTSTTSTPSIDWSGKTSDVTLLPWAQGTQSKPVGLSVPTFDVDDDDDDLIDWTAAPAAAPAVTTVSQTTPTLSASKNGNGHVKK